MAKRLDILEEKFLNTIKNNNLIDENEVIVVGVSGGPDSITLLECLKKYQEQLKIKKIIVAHINHLIRKDSTEDEQYVESYCKKNNIAFYAKRIEVERIAQENKRGTEETGREIRCQFFDEIMEKEQATKIAIAHNMNDNAETVLLNLIRGTGMYGLEGIQPIEYNKFIKPLINCQRKEIEEYCKKHQLNPRIDSTNKENIYTRNKVRNLIIPELEKINPNLIKTLQRTTEIIKEENLYIEKQAQNQYRKLAHINKNHIEFDLKEIKKEDIAIQKRLINKAISALSKSQNNVSKVNIDDVIKMIERNVGNKTIKINKKIEILIKNKKIFINLVH